MEQNREIVAQSLEPELVDRLTRRTPIGADFPAYCASKAFLHSWLTLLHYQLRTLPIEVLKLSLPYVQTELTGAEQASDPRAMPVNAYAAEVMRLLDAGDHSRGEVLLERDQARRWAEREGRYDAVFAALNPS